MRDFSLALHTDLYQLTMAYGYFKEGIADKETVFHHFFRKKPFGGEYAIVCGLDNLIDFIQNFRFSTSDLDYLKSLKGSNDLPLFDDPFLEYLANFSFTLDIDAAPEGTVIFPYEPIIRVQGSLLQAQLLESALLNIVNFQTLIATKASRILVAAEGQEVVEFGMRRAQGIDGALSASRASFVGGCSATSNVLAGKKFGIPVKGTHAHSWVMSFSDEQQAFESFAHIMPGNATFLVDTYDSIQGTKKAIAVAKSKGADFKFLAVRLDSGDLAQLSIEIRKLLDQAGFLKTKIMASNELDEFIIRDLKHQGAKIDVWCVGTSLSTAKGQSALDGVYKLSAYKDEKGQWQQTIKISEQLIKTTNPGNLEVRRYYTDQGYIADMIYDRMNPTVEAPTLIHPIDSTKKKKILGKISHHDLLIPIFKEGNCIYYRPKLKQIQDHMKREMEKFHPSVMRFLYPNPFFVGLESSLYETKIALMERIKNEKSSINC
ncbi:MAG: nicotinate phosphoribosyltransferase [Rhabdochlamydiaceae bacterium]|nr:nicotinate phosphoribosyltransferase [Candidatus Amphrikana amoebophyrae]